MWKNRRIGKSRKESECRMEKSLAAKLKQNRFESENYR